MLLKVMYQAEINFHIKKMDTNSLVQGFPKYLCHSTTNRGPEVSVAQQTTA